MVHDPVRDLYIVFTRWGRIGSQGQNQRTPFSKVEEAKKEFNSIFKQKTGNDFADLSKFSRVAKKYDLTKVRYVSAQHRDYLAPFDFEKCPQSSLEKNTRNLLEEVGNVTMYEKAISHLGLDTQALAVSNIDRDVLLEAQGLLAQISEAIEEDEELCRKSRSSALGQGEKFDMSELQTVRDKIQSLSGRF